MSTGCSICELPTLQGCSACKIPLCGNLCLAAHSQIACGLYKEEAGPISVFRNVVYTGRYMQYVEMKLQPGQEIGMEQHGETDQFFHILSGSGQLITKPKDGTADHIKELKKGTIAMVPAGTWHNVVADDRNGLTLYTLYAPPEH